MLVSSEETNVEMDAGLLGRVPEREELSLVDRCPQIPCNIICLLQSDLGSGGETRGKPFASWILDKSIVTHSKHSVLLH